MHRLKEGRKLVLGGCTIEHKYGLDGHSDADVLIHAVMDALLGAIGGGDIGQHFPDTDERYKGADSIELLKEVCNKVAREGYKIENIDSTIIAQGPKLSPYIGLMRKNIAKACRVEEVQVNVKATTEEGLGFTGSGEGISSQAICLLVPVMDISTFDYMGQPGGCSCDGGCRNR